MVLQRKYLTQLFFHKHIYDLTHLVMQLFSNIFTLHNSLEVTVKGEDSTYNSQLFPI